MTTLKREIREIINQDVDLQVKLTAITLEKALEDIGGSAPERICVNLTKHMTVYGCEQMKKRVLHYNSNNSSTWKSLMTHYDQHPYWLMIHGNTKDRPLLSSDTVAIIGFDDHLDPRIFSIVKSCLFNGSLTSPGFSRLPAEQVTAICLKKSVAHNSNEDPPQTERRL